MKNNTAPELHDKSTCEALYRQHGSIRAVATALSVDWGTVDYWIKKHGVNVSRMKVKKTEVQQEIQQEKERIDRERQRRLYQELKRKAALNEMIIEALKEAIIPVPLHGPVTVNLPVQPLSEETETAVAVISDCQIGKITPDYNVEKFQQRLKSMRQTIEKLVTLHRKNYRIDELVVLMAGDIVDGECIYPGHAFGIEQSVINQVYQTGLPAFVEFFQILSYQFKSIRVVCVPGNHGRNSKFAAVETNWDRVFFLSLQLALQNLTSIEWEIAENENFYVTTAVNGHEFLVIHGDEIPIWMNIPYYGIERSSSRWAQSIPRGAWEYLVMGHFHQSAWLKSNAKKIIMNGCFPTDDPWVLKKLKLDTCEAVQWLFGVHSRGVSWRYEIDLLKEAV